MNKEITPGTWVAETDWDEDGDFETGSVVVIDPDAKLRIGPGPEDFEPDVSVYTVADGVQNAANRRLICAAPDLLAALEAMRAFIAVMIGEGPDAVIPEAIQTPLGVPVRIGEIMREVAAALAKAAPVSR